MPKLTKRFVDGVRPGDAEAFHWDRDLPGFGLRVFPSGRRSYLVQYRASGRTRRMALGAHGALSPDEARRQARQVLAAVGRGDDPSADRAAAKRAPSVSEFCERYLVEHAEDRKKPRSVHEDRRLIERQVKPALGRRRVLDVTRPEVVKLHNALRATPYQANRVLALLSKMFNLAERWGLRPDGSNPCRHVEKFPERKRERFMSVDELGRLGGVLARAAREGTERPAVIRAIRLLIFTGCRLSEILTLHRDHVDLEHGCLRLPDSKTGAKVVYLNAPALEVIADALREDGDWIIPSARTGRHMVNLEKPWRTLRRQAGLEGVRLHDLRHSFASMGAGAGLGLPIIGALLGHQDAATTKRYAHLADDPLRQASEAIGKRLVDALAGARKSVDVTPLRPRRSSR